jgi:hypothetical protein
LFAAIHSSMFFLYLIFYLDLRPKGKKIDRNRVFASATCVRLASDRRQLASAIIATCPA